MKEKHYYSYVEDRPSAEIAKKLFDYTNKRSSKCGIYFHDGFPMITGGFGNLKTKASKYIEMAKSGVNTFTITDLDDRVCAGMLIRDWFSIEPESPIDLSGEIVFRIAVREIESWILADRIAWAKFINISETNWSCSPDLLPDPKQYLLNIVRRKGRKKIHREMLPRGTAHIGPQYNDVLCEFIVKRWSPHRAANLSPSLRRAIEALDQQT